MHGGGRMQRRGGASGVPGALAVHHSGTYPPNLPARRPVGRCQRTYHLRHAATSSVAPPTWVATARSAHLLPRLRSRGATRSLPPSRARRCAAPGGCSPLPYRPTVARTGKQ